MELDWKILLQVIGVILGLLYLWLEYKADIRLWIVGLIMPMVHGILYYQKGLYADSSMQVYYVLAGVYGWIIWERAKRRGKSPKANKIALKICHTPSKMVLPLFASYVLAHGIIYWFLTQFTNSNVPFWDSLTTALSIIAMWMLSRKYVEQWLVWLFVDLITVGLYFYKGIPITACLYLLYSCLAFAGFLRWRKQA